MEIKPRIESDHLPVEIYLKGKRERIEEERRVKKKKEYRLIWNGEKELEYRAKMEERGRELKKIIGVRKKDDIN